MVTSTDIGLGYWLVVYLIMTWLAGLFSTPTSSLVKTNRDRHHTETKT